MLRSAALVAICLLALLQFVACSDDDPAPTGPGDVPAGQFVDPVWEYGRGEGISVTGGYVYRGQDLPALEGAYVYGDFGSGKIWALEFDGVDDVSNRLLVESGLSITSFGVGPDDEIYVLDYGSGRRLQKLVGTVDGLPGVDAYDVVPVFDATFDFPVDMRHAGDGRIFVVEQAGRIRVFDPADTGKDPTTFLDIRDRVTSGGELGLLGLAFHPDYASNGYFYVYYTAGTGPWTSHLVRFRVSSDPDVADVLSALELLSFGQEFPNHNGGGLTFDAEGHLLLAVGDEGSAGDPKDNAQDPTNVYGAILRLDVDGGTPYAIPTDNPFADGIDGAPEVFAYGLRNPWRISVDPVNGRIWAGDVGQNSTEEIDVIVAGGNYGWDCKEGSTPYAGDSASVCFEE